MRRVSPLALQQHAGLVNDSELRVRVLGRERDIRADLLDVRRRGARRARAVTRRLFFFFASKRESERYARRSMRLFRSHVE